jgi:hypothetical protein
MARCRRADRADERVWPTMESPNPTTVDALRPILKNQIHAALAMLREGIERCPDDLWTDDGHPNAVWQLAYHTLYFTHMYLGPDHEAFRPWSEHRGDVQNPDGIAGPPEPGDPRPLVPQPYTREQVLAYWRWCDGWVDDAVDALDLASPESGFPWYRMSKLEHQLVNLRHVQHHAAQIADRLRNWSRRSGGDIGVRWVGGSRPR